MKQKFRLVLATGMTLVLSTLLSGAYSVEYVPSDFVLQAHRGGGQIGSENTLEGCLFAWGLGAVPEVDVRTTSDGVLVAFHDATMRRVARGLPEKDLDRGIESFSYDELLKLDVGLFRGEYFRGHRIPMMYSIFEAMRGHRDRWLYLHVKHVSLEKLATVVSHFGVQDRVILASADYADVKAWNALLPHSNTQIYIGGSEEKVARKLEELRMANFEGISHIQIHARISSLDAEDPFTPSSAFFRNVAAELEQHGILFQSLPWDTCDPEVYWKLMDLGVDSFATDFPQQTLQAVSDYFRRKLDAP